MATYTLKVSDAEMHLLRLALTHWDGDDGESTIDDTAEDALYALLTRTDELVAERDRFCRP